MSVVPAAIAPSWPPKTTDGLQSLRRRALESSTDRKSYRHTRGDRPLVVQKIARSRVRRILHEAMIVRCRVKRCTAAVCPNLTTILIAKHQRAPATTVRRTLLRATTDEAMRAPVRTATEIPTKTRLTRREKATPIAGTINGHVNDNQKSEI